MRLILAVLLLTLFSGCTTVALLTVDLYDGCRVQYVVGKVSSPFRTGMIWCDRWYYDSATQKSALVRSDATRTDSEKPSLPTIPVIPF